MNIPSHFAESLLNWYKDNARVLPFRGAVSPYAIWISEVIMQQTRMNQGLDYYKQFINRFPDIRSLAESSEEEVLKIWQGLGYYSRARNIRQAAQYIMNIYHGEMPSSYQELKKIKGIGSYTAAAISSIAFHEVIPAIDGNAKRVFSRYLGIKTPVDTTFGRISIEKAASSLIDPSQPGNFNQAIMELGALICTNQRPSCLRCPLLKDCIAYNENQIEHLPSKAKKPVVKERFIYYFVFSYRNGNQVKFILRRRIRNDIWKGLYDFPSLDFTEVIDLQNFMQLENLNNQFPWLGSAELRSIHEPVKHLLTHRILWLHFVIYQVYGMPVLEDKNLGIYSLQEALNLPLPRPIEKFIKELTEKPCI